ncbi:hypothetical protein AB5I41_12570 [Sphingomonas sp. MMS24-JH45]
MGKATADVAIYAVHAPAPAAVAAFVAFLREVVDEAAWVDRAEPRKTPTRVRSWRVLRSRR